ncbi:MAG: peptide-methionine (S)-S-oxide reductase MsrA [Deltaproteobacteria bacterium]|nr:peptide-methionine (S)-S-oxide reductase MsrA [Deltaproteobacteria bacterium]
MTATATFGAGCFWGVEETFRQVEGVEDAVSGYMGGHKDNPTYQEVCTDTTGHAEVVQVTYDPEKVSYEELLEIFWSNHNPTTKDRQGPDVGRQYRSAIFFHDDKQREIAEASLERQEASKRFPAPIVTEITKAQTFWRAEEYHQRYLERRGLSSCHI